MRHWAYHVSGAILAAAAGVYAFAWSAARLSEQDYIMTMGRVCIWSAMFYLLVGIILSARTALGSADGPSARSWFLHVTAALLGFAGACWGLAYAQRGPGGDFRDLGTICVAAGGVYALVGVVVDLVTALRARTRAAASA